MFNRILLVPYNKIVIASLEAALERIKNATPTMSLTPNFDEVMKTPCANGFDYSIRSPHGIVQYNRPTAIVIDGEHNEESFSAKSAIEIVMCISPGAFMSTADHGDGWDKLTIGDGLRNHIRYIPMLCDELLTLGEMQLIGLWLPSAFPETAIVLGRSDRLTLTDLRRVAVSIDESVEATGGNYAQMLYAAELYSGFMGKPTAFLNECPRIIYGALTQKQPALLWEKPALPT